MTLFTSPTLPQPAGFARQAPCCSTLTPDAELAAFISDVGHVDLACRDERMHQACLERFRGWQGVEIRPSPDPSRSASTDS